MQKTFVGASTLLFLRAEENSRRRRQVFCGEKICPRTALVFVYIDRLSRTDFRSRKLLSVFVRILSECSSVMAARKSSWRDQWRPVSCLHVRARAQPENGDGEPGDGCAIKTWRVASRILRRVRGAFMGKFAIGLVAGLVLF